MKVFTNKSSEVYDEELDTPITSKVKAKLRIKKKTAKMLQKQSNWKKYDKFQRFLNVLPSD